MAAGADLAKSLLHGNIRVLPRLEGEGELQQIWTTFRDGEERVCGNDVADAVQEQPLDAGGVG